MKILETLHPCEKNKTYAKFLNGKIVFMRLKWHLRFHSEEWHKIPSKKRQPVKIGWIVLIKIPEVDRWHSAPWNVIAVVTETKDNLYQLGTKSVLKEKMRKCTLKMSSRLLKDNWWRYQTFMTNEFFKRTAGAVDSESKLTTSDASTETPAQTKWYFVVITMLKYFGNVLL